MAMTNQRLRRVFIVWSSKYRQAARRFGFYASSTWLKSLKIKVQTKFEPFCVVKPWSKEYTSVFFNLITGATQKITTNLVSCVENLLQQLAYAFLLWMIPSSWQPLTNKLSNHRQVKLRRSKESKDQSTLFKLKTKKSRWINIRLRNVQLQYYKSLESFQVTRKTWS